MRARIVATLEDLCIMHDGGAVVCFSHADPSRATIAHALGTHPDLIQRITVSPGSVAAISYVKGPAPSVLTVNSTLDPLGGPRTP